MKWLIVVLFCFSTASLLQAQDAELDGKTLFRNNCKACHHMEMRLVGPALAGVTERMEMDWLVKFIKSSTSVIQSGDAYADSLFLEYNQVLMPDQNLSGNEITAILDYIKEESNKKEETQAIERPQITQSNMVPMKFSDYRWWIIYTVSLFLLIAGLHKLVDMDDLIREVKDKSN